MAGLLSVATVPQIYDRYKSSTKNGTMAPVKEAGNTNTVARVLGILILLVAAGAAGYFIYDFKTKNDALTAEGEHMRQQLVMMQRQLAAASSTIAKLDEELEETKEELEDTEEDLEEEEERNEQFAEQIEKLTGTVTDLDKLSKTDEELLQKYSKVYFLNENYVPSDLDRIDDDYVLENNGDGDEHFHADAMPFLEDLMEAAEDDDIDLKIASAYRSFDEQANVKDQHTTVFGSGANTFSADQGYSEHQLGTTIDFTTPELRCVCEEFAQTEAYEWLLDNAHEYGFVLSYPEGNQYYVFEPWHWRFVGEDLAEDLEEGNANFYDWEQREIDEYLISIFD